MAVCYLLPLLLAAAVAASTHRDIKSLDRETSGPVRLVSKPEHSVKLFDTRQTNRESSHYVPLAVEESSPQSVAAEGPTKSLPAHKPNSLPFPTKIPNFSELSGFNEGVIFDDVPTVEEIRSSTRAELPSKKVKSRPKDIRTKARSGGQETQRLVSAEDVIRDQRYKHALKGPKKSKQFPGKLLPSEEEETPEEPYPTSADQTVERGASGQQTDSSEPYIPKTPYRGPVLPLLQDELGASPSPSPSPVYFVSPPTPGAPVFTGPEDSVHEAQNFHPVAQFRPGSPQFGGFHPISPPMQRAAPHHQHRDVSLHGPHSSQTGPPRNFRQISQPNFFGPGFAENGFGGRGGSSEEGFRNGRHFPLHGNNQDSHRGPFFFNGHDGNRHNFDGPMHPQQQRQHVSAPRPPPFNHESRGGDGEASHNLLGSGNFGIIRGGIFADDDNPRPGFGFHDNFRHNGHRPHGEDDFFQGFQDFQPFGGPLNNALSSQTERKTPTESPRRKSKKNRLLEESSLSSVILEPADSSLVPVVV